MRVAILGAGNWGTTLALLVASRGIEVNLWEGCPERAIRLRADRENREFLPGHTLGESVHVPVSLSLALEGAEAVLIVLPSHVVREVVGKAAPLIRSDILVVSATKGLEQGSLMRMSEVLAEELHRPPDSRLVVLSGPSIANEVVRGVPTAVVAASRNPDAASAVQAFLMTPTFRVYTSHDVVGVELGGALKNVIAIAAGICDGLGFGANTKGALLTRGLAEMARMGVAMGSDRITFAGLSGAGDLITTCTSSHSRNRYVGEQIGRGKSLEEVLSSMVMVAEGVRTTRSARDLALRHGVEMPITEQIYQILFAGKMPEVAVSELMLREPKSELWD